MLFVGAPAAIPALAAIRVPVAIPASTVISATAISTPAVIPVASDRHSRAGGNPVKKQLIIILTCNPPPYCRPLRAGGDPKGF